SVCQEPTNRSAAWPGRGGGPGLHPDRGHFGQAAERRTPKPALVVRLGRPLPEGDARAGESPGGGSRRTTGSGGDGETAAPRKPAAPGQAHLESAVCRRQVMTTVAGWD